MSKPPKGPRTAISLQIDWDLLVAFDAVAMQEGVSRQAYIAEAMRTQLKECERKRALSQQAPKVTP